MAFCCDLNNISYLSLTGTLNTTDCDEDSTPYKKTDFFKHRDSLKKYKSDGDTYSTEENISDKINNTDTRRSLTCIKDVGHGNNRDNNFHRDIINNIKNRDSNNKNYNTNTDKKNYNNNKNNNTDNKENRNNSTENGNNSTENKKSLADQKKFKAHLAQSALDKWHQR